MRHITIFMSVLLFFLTSLSFSQGPHRHRHGKDGSTAEDARRPGRHDPAHAADREVFHFLLDHREEIERTIKEIPGGVETVTASADPEVTSQIRVHVRSMHSRLLHNRPIHRRDPLFAEIFDHADEIQMKIEETERGLRVVETSEDPYVTKLIRAHARVIDQFLEHGRSEVRKNHPVPSPTSDSSE